MDLTRLFNYDRYRGVPCLNVPRGKLYLSKSPADAALYERAGCSVLGDRQVLRTFSMRPNRQMTLFSYNVNYPHYCCPSGALDREIALYVDSVEYKSRLVRSTVFGTMVAAGFSYLLYKFLFRGRDQ
jgi:hypothetical protein